MKAVVKGWKVGLRIIVELAHFYGVTGGAETGKNSMHLLNKQRVTFFQ